MKNPFSRSRHLEPSRLFFGFLFIGMLSGALFGKLSKTMSEEKLADSQQINTLLVLVQDADSESSPLLGLWLAAIPLQGKEISWVPIYPRAHDEQSSSLISDSEPIRIDSSIDFQWEGLAPVREAGVFWDKVILIDVKGLNSLLEQVDEKQPVTLTPTWEQAPKALQEQVAIVEQICTLSPPALSLDLLLNQYENSVHLQSDMSSFEIIALWDQFFGTSTPINCQHPWAS